jgi:hypothetical protein
MLPAILVLILGVVFRLLALILNGVIFPGGDIKFHSMLVELICLNKGFSQTFEPFVHQIAAYPPGFHVVVSFFSVLTGQLSTKVLSIFICFIYGLVGLGFYSLMYALSKSKVASFISCLSVLFLSGEISLISLWGGVTLLLALYFTSTFLAFIYFDIPNLSCFFSCLSGISFAAAFVTNTGLALMGLIFLIPFLLKKVLANSDNYQVKVQLKSVLLFLASSFICLLLLFPLILPSVRQILGLVPADLMTPNVHTDAHTYGGDWYYVENFIPRVILNHGTFMAMILMLSVPIFVTLLSVFSQNKSPKLKKALSSYSVVFSWIFILLIFGVNNPIGLFFFEFPLWDLFVPSRIFTYLLLPLCMLAGFLFQFMFDIIKYARAINVTRPQVKHLAYASAAIFLIFSVGLVCGDINNNISTESIGKNRIPISISDLECFEWIKNNTGIENRFLVETSDAGQYIPSFCDRPVVYPSTLLQFDSRYIELKELIYHSPDDNKTLDLLRQFKVDYIFIGSKATISPFFTFDSDLLLASSHYQLAFCSGQSFIFKIK